MRKYETVFIVHPDLSAEERQPLFKKLTNLISDHHGLLVKIDEWGERKLAYEIKKQTRGYYTLMEFCGNGDLVKELERTLRLDDGILKYMTVLLDKGVDVEAIKAEIEARKEKEAKAEPVQEEVLVPQEPAIAVQAEAPETAIAKSEESEKTIELERQEEETTNGDI